jgi:hypothetical protein
MYYENYILVDKDDFEKIKNKLNIVKLLIEDKYAREKLEEILYILQKEDEVEKPIPIEEIIYMKMNESKNTNPELNANLYMLYRKLQEKKIDPVEAMSLYQIYIND